MQNTFVAGIATDVIPTPDQVYITSVVDAAATPNWCNAAQDDACGARAREGGGRRGVVRAGR